MGRVGKKYTKAREIVTKPHYALPEAVSTVTKASFAKFDETVEVAMRLGVDPKHADFVGGDDMVKKIQDENWLDFDALVATPDMMKSVGKLGKVLGPRGLMPNPKTGTVTFEVAKAVREIKAGKVEYRVDKTSIIHAPIGKVSFGPDKLLDNAKAIIESILKARPSAAKGKYVKSIALSSTMGPGVRVDPASVEASE